jgi:hypothetical protein
LRVGNELAAVDDRDALGKFAEDLSEDSGEGAVLPISLGAITRRELGGKSDYTFKHPVPATFEDGR